MSPVGVDLMTVTQAVAFQSVGDLLAFRWRSVPRTITPYLYNADGTPADTGRTAITLAASPTIASVLITWAKRTGGATYVLAFVTRSGAADNTLAIYDVSGDVWSSEVAARPSGQNDGTTRYFTETGDEFFYETMVPSATSTFYLEKLSTAASRSAVNTATGRTNFYHVDDDTIGVFNTAGGAEITIAGSVTDPTAYDETGTIFANQIAFPASNPTSQRLMFRTIQPLPYEVAISGADLTQVSRSSGWSTSGWKSVALNDNKTAFGIFPQSQTASPPSETLDWIDALPKTGVHGSAVEIRPTDYVDAGTPGTLGELPDSVIPLGAAP